MTHNSCELDSQKIGAIDDFKFQIFYVGLSPFFAEVFGTCLRDLYGLLPSLGWILLQNISMLITIVSKNMWELTLTLRKLSLKNDDFFAKGLQKKYFQRIKRLLWWGPAQDVHFFYTHSCFNAQQSCKLIFLANFSKKSH